MEIDIKKIGIKDFKINLDDGKKLTLNPPKLKVLRKAMGVSKAVGSAEDIDEIIEVVALILSGNKEKRKITTGFVEENFDINQLLVIMEKYVEWVGDIYKNPNS